MHGFNKLLGIMAVVMMLFFIACSPRLHSVRIERPALPEPGPAVAGLSAGLARVDITPPPGIATAGYSLMAEVSRGFRTRLYARAVYIEDGSGRKVTLVACDFLSGSRLLQHRVAELAAPATGIGVQELIIAGTHTHSGPGNYFSSNFYNSLAGGKSGFDPQLFDFLADRIAEAVISAHAARRPAKIATGSAEIYGMTRNRSMAPFLTNPDLPPDAIDDPTRAVNPLMTMIRIDLKDDNGVYQPAGAFSSFSIHPTVIPHWNKLYTADVFGYIARELEFALEKEHAAPWPMVHAAANGTHGDNSPNYARGRQDYAEAKRIGVEVGRRAIELFTALEAALSDDVAVRSACREVDLFTHPSIDGVSVCERPVVGNALTAGAEDGRHPILYRTPFFREGWGTARWFFTGSCQGHKRHVGSVFQPLVLKKQDFPHVLFFQVIQVADRVFVPMPFEITCRSGAMIAAQVADALQTGPNQVAVISCANGYFGYATTPAEYTRQHYEGGHTLYGPGTVPFLARHAASLALAMDQGRPADIPASWSVELKAKAFFPEDRTPGGERAVYGRIGYDDDAAENEPAFEFQWQDVPPAMIELHRPLVRIETSPDGTSWEPLSDKGGRPVDDTGYDVSVALEKTIGNGMAVYQTRWYNPATEAGRYYRFAVLPRGGFDTLYSEPFVEDRKE